MNQKSLKNAKHSNYLIRKYGGYQTNPIGRLLGLKLGFHCITNDAISLRRARRSKNGILVERVEFHCTMA